MPARTSQDNGVVKRWQLVLGTASVVLTMATFVFRAGVLNAQLEQRMTSIEHRMDYDETVLARKDVIEQRLLNIEEEEKRIEKLEQDRNDELRNAVRDRR